MTETPMRVPGYDYLYSLRNRYTVRVQIPPRLRPAIGKGEFKKALGGDFSVAKRLYHGTVAGFLAEIEAAKKNIFGSGPPSTSVSLPSEEEIEVACHAHFVRMAQSMRGMVAHPVGDVPGARRNRIEGYRVMIENQLDAFEQDVWSSMTSQALWLCEEKNWTLSEGSPTFEQLCRLMMRARLQCYRDELRRLEGKLADDPDADPMFGPTPPKGNRTSRTLGSLLDKFREVRGPKWAGSTEKNYTIVFRVLEEICGRGTALELVDEDFCSRVRAVLVGLPSNYQKLPATRGKSVAEAVVIAETRGLRLISPATVNSHLNKLGAIVRFGRDRGWILGNPMSEIDVPDPVDPADKRDPFSIKQLNTLFASAPWSDGEKAPNIYPSRYWAPLIGLFSGARLTDICGQRVDEMIEIDGIPVFNFVHRPGDRHVKGGKSRRVPVHRQLLEMGFWEFVKEARKSGREHLFSDVKRDTLGKWGDGTSDWFTRKLIQLEIKSAKLSFHSFRHSFEDALRRANLHDTPIGNAIAGRWSPGVSKNYGSRYPTSQLQEAIEKVSYPGLRLP